MIDNERHQYFMRMALRHGLVLEEPFATDVEMRNGIRELGSLPPGTRLTDLQRRALLQNLRQVVLKTACAVYPDPTASVAAQSRLPRWRHLPDASPGATNAFVEVLRYFGIVPPSYLLPEAGND